MERFALGPARLEMQGIVGLHRDGLEPARTDAGSRFAGTRGLSGLFLAAVVAGMVVLADQLINTWADGHLMLAWVLLQRSGG